MRASMTALVLMATVSGANAADLRDPLATADAFDRAITTGDEKQVLAMLAPDVLIYESGGQEASRDEYAASHLKADIAFMAQMQRKVLGRKQGAAGELAWVATRSRVSGTYKDKPVDMFSTETLVLKQQADGWRIVHIQWSSQPATPKAH
jgi:ketosteroid isomerase-like protein